MTVNLFTAMVPYHGFSSVSIWNNFTIDSLRHFHVKICDISSLPVFYLCFLVSYFKLTRTAHAMYSCYMYALANRLLISLCKKKRHSENFLLHLIYTAVLRIFVVVCLFIWNLSVASASAKELGSPLVLKIKHRKKDRSREKNLQFS